MGITFSHIKDARVQIFLTWEMPLWLYTIFIILIPIVTVIVLDVLISKRYFSKKATTKRILLLNVIGAFVITFALTANSGIRFGDLPSAVSFFNPLIGFYPIYVAYLLQKAIYDGRIK